MVDTGATRARINESGQIVYGPALFVGDRAALDASDISAARSVAYERGRVTAVHTDGAGLRGIGGTRITNSGMG